MNDYDILFIIVVIGNLILYIPLSLKLSTLTVIKLHNSA